VSLRLGGPLRESTLTISGPSALWAREFDQYDVRILTNALEENALAVE
jgi:hypothetical protein